MNNKEDKLIISDDDDILMYACTSKLPTNVCQEEVICQVSEAPQLKKLLSGNLLLTNNTTDMLATTDAKLQIHIRNDKSDTNRAENQQVPIKLNAACHSENERESANLMFMSSLAMSSETNTLSVGIKDNVRITQEKNTIKWETNAFESHNECGSLAFSTAMNNLSGMLSAITAKQIDIPIGENVVEEIESMVSMESGCDVIDYSSECGTIVRMDIPINESVVEEIELMDSDSSAVDMPNVCNRLVILTSIDAFSSDADKHIDIPLDESVTEENVPFESIDDDCDQVENCSRILFTTKSAGKAVSKETFIDHSASEKIGSKESASVVVGSSNECNRLLSPSKNVMPAGTSVQIDGSIDESATDELESMESASGAVDSCNEFSCFAFPSTIDELSANYLQKDFLINESPGGAVDQVKDSSCLVFTTEGGAAKNEVPIDESVCKEIVPLDADNAAIFGLTNDSLLQVECQMPTEKAKTKNNTNKDSASNIKTKPVGRNSWQTVVAAAQAQAGKKNDIVSNSVVNERTTEKFIERTTKKWKRLLTKPLQRNNNSSSTQEEVPVHALFLQKKTNRKSQRPLKQIVPTSTSDILMGLRSLDNHVHCPNSSGSADFAVYDGELNILNSDASHCSICLDGKPSACASNDIVDRKKKRNIGQDFRDKFSSLTLRQADMALKDTDKALKQSRPSLDVVLRWGEDFDSLLNDKYGLALFRGFLRTEFSDENIEFWIACEEYKALVGVKKQQIKAQKIYQEFVAVQAPREVNLDSTTRLQTIEALSSPNKHTFENAQKRIQALMDRDSYKRFLRSEVYNSLLREIRAASSITTSSSINNCSSASSSSIVGNASGSSSSPAANKSISSSSSTKA